MNAKQLERASYIAAHAILTINTSAPELACPGARRSHAIDVIANAIKSVFELHCSALDEAGDRYFLPSIIYYQQQKSNSISFGCEYKDARVGIGAWYRGNVNFQNGDAFAITLSLDLFDRRENETSRARIGLAYDATISKLGFSRSAGSGEGAFVWEKLTPTGIKSEDRCDEDFRMKGTPCPPRF